MIKPLTAVLRPVRAFALRVRDRRACPACSPHTQGIHGEVGCLGSIDIDELQAKQCPCQRTYDNTDYAPKATAKVATGGGS